MGAPRQPGRTTRRGEHGSVALDHLTAGARYRARYRDRYVGSFESLADARKALDELAALDTEGPKKQAGRKHAENGVIKKVVLSTMHTRFRARYRQHYLGTYDTLGEAKKAIAAQKARLGESAGAAGDEGSSEGRLEKSGTSGASPHEKA